MRLVKTIIICQECQMPYHKALWEPTWLAKIAAEPHHEEWHTTFTEPEHSKIVAGWREWERERIIKLIEEMPWIIYQGVAHDGRILNLPTPKVLDRETAISLIKGETK